ncbi:MAG: GNAT family N-acetyltransferase [Burkholderiales bacterium]|nr:GNAT family N-acetyltransferase [Burkholderiales bacterium]
MSPRLNAYGQPVGFPVEGWTAPPMPPRTVLEGRYCRLEPLNAERHAAGLDAANRLDPDDRGWTYMSNGPYATAADYRAWVEAQEQREDPRFYAIIDCASGEAGGVASYMRIDPANGCIEVGGIKLTPLVSRKPAMTEAMYLMMNNAFGLGYRRYEWKCDALNAPSRAAARRLGFTFEGIFRQAIVYKGRNRDTAWFSITDREWPAIRAAHERWLAPENFDTEGRQKTSLSSLTAPLLRARD